MKTGKIINIILLALVAILIGYQIRNLFFNPEIDFRTLFEYNRKLTNFLLAYSTILTVSFMLGLWGVIKNSAKAQIGFDIVLILIVYFVPPPKGTMTGLFVYIAAFFALVAAIFIQRAGSAPKVPY